MFVIFGSVPYLSITWCIRRRFISGVIHSRACCALVYRTDGFFPSLVVSARWLTFIAMMSWPLTVLPMLTILVICGAAAAACSNSALIPSGPAYFLKTSYPSAASWLERSVAVLPLISLGFISTP